ncbi:MAG: hypothetical protein WBM98_10150 [Maribacter sp.]|uniref:hypothetical protein n=1 Tax=Maribacter sp. TaxID=1897614 RepID=UPI003C746A20
MNKKILLALVLICIMLPKIYSQAKEDSRVFLLTPDSVTVYGSVSDTKGFTLIDEFDDHYSLKLTNRLYKVNLFFPKDRKEALNTIVTRILGAGESLKNQKIWKKANSNKKPEYTIAMTDGKVKIRIYRKQMDAETYASLNELGGTILEEINN